MLAAAGVAAALVPGLSLSRTIEFLEVSAR